MCIRDRPIIGYAVIFTHWLLIPAGFLFLASFLGWALEPADDPEAAHGHDDHGHGDDGDDDHGSDGTDGDDGDDAEMVTEGAETVG